MIAICRYFFLLALFCDLFFAKDLNRDKNADISKDAILAKIQELYNAPLNEKSQALTCNLTKKQLDEVKLDINSPIFPYFNALLELNTSEKISKIAQDLLMQEVRNKDRLHTLLALQLHFIKKCDRCEKVRDISNFDYYRFSNSNVQKLLYTEGGNFKSSFVLHGEAFLCKALESKSLESKKDSKLAQYFLKSYANFMLAGLHTRALNVLLYGLSLTNDNALYATFKFLASNDIVILKNLNSVHLLKIMELDSKNYFKNINMIRNFKNLKAIEGSLVSNYVISGLLIRDMDMGRILSPFSKFATQQTIDEFKQKQQYYEQELQDSSLKILKNATKQEIYEYYRILTLKERLKGQISGLITKLY
ncbi:hypothetical protein DCO58_08960 [Helicobacter saguini]|uniref:Uncharacterized protein n=1 Tax=Helicobacter saguini TaxID=1548018 RepID=A0A347W585_9HELI|nr:hypothetical protein [Helicobacter saguini]MWV61550.1 hypothetical protein [Helicobacter saguini]MWV67780.1 hypothetical protein [Helicobacter saguini]MWV70752.1 hypothetical protein [Helicobacter saguini]MWV72656.1 hypothetical protein [Helicobacter saguini]TLD94540.1 hypothetical protein LS64_005060 [Helicobacter saguini]